MSLKVCECGVVYEVRYEVTERGREEVPCPVCAREEVLLDTLESLSKAAMTGRGMPKAIMALGGQIGSGVTNYDVYLDEEFPNYVAFLKAIGEYPEFEDN